MLNQLPAFLSVIVTDVFGAEGWPAGGLAGYGLTVAVEQLRRRRTEKARDILLDELRHGERTLSDAEKDETVAVLSRYGRAAQEGAARVNLRLMAKVIAGRARLQDLHADEFLRYADIIAGLRREEIVLLGSMQRHWTMPDVQALGDDTARRNEAKRRMMAELVPIPFADVVELMATEDAIVRTGFLAGTPLLSGTVYKPTKALLTLWEFASLEAALIAEPAGRGPG